MTEHHEEHHTVSYRFNTIIWGILLCLTAVTVIAAQFDFGFLNVVVALTIATVKAGLVILFFMHLKYEKPLFKIIVFITFFLLAIAIGFTFFDIGYRY
ncbi:cytochrome C oxidase subunit IV family protein [Desulfovibrio subterraneus]|jgi:cytochrome c oxidase subunit 4|uniref:Cytochrome-c oxidase n=1 Tax=Desulfovibrio subterraneus TaxID=2718620 RepID=A0A7J0BJ70_9BACT|nr:cytochrome C oxidase subunit IV family protein [Desulfovibrio subterraneus]WBF67954.1 cytochrome C oxidase subunit IV family protein [Desulfovibrio subterraneus]GFM33823.1 cytochrome-c oxidase [Desulfovibrio subterraneus]